MPTIIDSLVIELGLDSSKFNEVQKKAVDSLRTLQDNATKNLKPVQKGFDDLGESFRLIQGRLLAIGALIATGLGFNRLVQDVTKANTELGNLSRTLGMTAQDLSAWENAGKTVGASTGEIAQNMKAINAQIQEFHATGKSSLQALMGQIGIKPMQPDDTPDSVAKRLSEWYVQQPNKAYASHLLQSRGGVSQGMLNMLALGPQELEKRLNFAKQFAPSNEDINQFKKLTDAFGNLMTVLTALERDAVLPLTNVLTKVLTMITDWLAKVHLAGENPPEAAGEGMDKLGYHELAPNKSKPGLFSRGWNWLRGRSSGSGEGAGSTPSPNDSVQNRFGNWQGVPGGGSAPAPSSGGSAFLQRQRQSFTDQAANPATRERILAMALTEGDRDPTRVIESLANRFGYVNDERAKRGLPPVTLDQMLTPAFYGPMRGPKFDQALQTIRSNAAVRGRMEGGLNNVSGGSNLLQGFTDQGLPTDPNGWRTPRLAHGGNVFNDWNGGARFGAGDYRNAAAWREKMMAGVANDNTRSPVTAGIGPIGSGADRSFRLWQNLGLGSKGALIRGGDSSTTNNSNTATTHIGSMNVTVPPGANPSQYAHGISQKLEQYNNVANSIQGLQ